jgi:homoserine dehydrogenase
MMASPEGEDLSGVSMAGRSLKPVKIGICGLGTVGAGTFNLLAENAGLLAARASVPIQVVHVGARRDNPDCSPGDVQVSRDIFAVARDPEVDILVELIGGTTVARELIEEAIRGGKHVVTANKALLAEFGNALFALAQKHNVSLRYEAAVAGGIPIVKALREGLAGNRIEWLDKKTVFARRVETRIHNQRSIHQQTRNGLNDKPVENN